LEEGKTNSQAPPEMGEISARLECQDELETPPGIKEAGDKKVADFPAEMRSAF